VRAKVATVVKRMMIEVVRMQDDFFLPRDQGDVQ
jgi:hypothetical protein